MRLRGIHQDTLRAQLSGTFLQTLARFGYATEGALFISAQLSTDAVGALAKGLGTKMTVEAAYKRPSTHVHMRRIHPGPVKEFRLDSNDCGFICACVNFFGGYK